MANNEMRRKTLNRFIRIKSVSLKLSLSVLITVICIVIAISSISFYFFRDTYERKVAEASTQTIEIAGKKTGQMLDSFIKIAPSLENTQDFINRITYYQAAEQDSFEESSLNSQIQRILESFLNVNASIRSISIIPEGMHPLITTADIQTLAPVFLDEDKEKMKESNWYKQIQSSDGKVVWLQPQTDPFITLYQDSHIYVMGQLLKNPLSKKPLGALVVELSTDNLAETLEGIQIGPSGKNVIVDSDQTIIYAEDYSLIGSRYEGILPKVNSSEEEIQAGSFRNNDEQGSNLYVYSYLSEASWFLLSYAPISKLLTDMNQMQSLILWVTVILAACSAILIGYMVQRSIGKPLNHIHALMLQGEQGNLQIRTNTQRFDQIGDLERSFDRMMDHITQLVKQANLSADAVLHTAEGLIESSKSTSSTSSDILEMMMQITNGAVKVAEDAEMCSSLTIKNNERIIILKTSNETLERLGHHLKEASYQGQAHMFHMLDQTMEVETRTNRLIEQVSQLREGTGNIEKIVQLLSKVSKQTAILSLNATIEASKAGEAGRGFMVIAQEIRQLADQAKASLNIVSQVLSLIVQNTESIVISLADLHPMLRLQTESTHQSKQIFEKLHQEVADFMEQLSTVQLSVAQLEQSQFSLSSAMVSVSSISEETSAASQEVLALSHNQMKISNDLSQSSNDLNTMASKLHESLSHFKL